MPPSKETLEALAISDGEYEAIVERLGREPNEVELGLFGSLWSEHCAYKHSKPLLRKLPNTSPRMLVATGQENAGAVDIGNGLAVVMKIESHNHPSAIEPYEGAATGVGGIVRDIFAMGARPIALLNSLRFGQPDTARNRYLFGGVVAGISEYGNCIGIPNVGGEVVFSDSYADNPLVNAMCVGIVPADKLISATTGAPGNLLMLVGADTGRDGIHGASGLASRSFEDDRELRPAVQVGNPFLEKVLIEACLELAESGRLVGLQDLGAAGLSTSSIETADKGGTGIRIDVSKVARRESGMTPYEVMLSESQERMLVVVAPDDASEVTKILDKWDLHATVIGESTGDGDVSIQDEGHEHGRLPVGLLTDAPLYRLTGVKPRWLTELQDFDLNQVPIPEESPADILLRLLASPNIASRLSVYRQYDHQVQTNTVVAPGGDAAVLRVKGTSMGIALATDGNGRKCYLDPHIGGMIAVAEACRNVSTVGATPIALTDCLNFGNPEKPEVYYQLEECVKGMSAASTAFAAPVISGNVSLYNESRGRDIYPTPIIGALGLLEDVSAHATMAFNHEGDIVVLLGSDEVRGDASSLAGSEYLENVHDKVVGRPTIDLDLEAAVQRVCRKAVAKGMVNSAHDCSDGGLAVALAESCIAGNIGFTGSFAMHGRWDAALFGETESRIVVSLPGDRLTQLEKLCSDEGVPTVVLGRVGGRRLTLGSDLDVDLGQVEDAWSGGLERAVGGEDGAFGSRL
ncbi:MAG: phosphoribosylformylglycinamidine synthase subunit PurL [Chloroflexi bacterium]|nr:phosphoribosylformylglycinamidine synthase subunit PurL [Chloroflexota bacterium]